MRIKNISFWERHLEKIVFGVLLLVTALVAWVYGVGDRYRIEMRIAGRPVVLGPERLEKEIVKVAEDLVAEVQSQVSPLPPLRIPDYTEEFRTRVNPTEVIRSFPTPLGWPGLDKDIFGQDGVQPGVIPDYDVPPVPVATDIRVRSGYGVLGELSNPDLMDRFELLIGDQRPRDFHYVSVGGYFDWETWRARLRESPAARRIPEDWWKSLQNITYVSLERETLDLSTGKWGGLTRIDQLPTSIHFADMERNWTKPEAQEAVRQIKSAAGQVARPPFPLLEQGPAWLPPHASEAAAQLMELNARIQELQDELRSLDAGETAADAGTTDRTTRAAREAGTAGELPRAGQTRRPVRARSQRDVRAIQRDLQEALTERATLAQQVDMSDLPPIPAPAVGAPGGDGLFGGLTSATTPRQPEGWQREFQTPTTADSKEAPEENRFMVWGHDLTARPGQVYRYRLVIGVINPLFQKDKLSDAQKELYFHQLSLESDGSEWSEPIEIGSQMKYFLTNTNQPRRTATIEVWRLFAGTWHNQEFTVEPGDPIGAIVTLNTGEQNQLVDFRIGSVAVDMDFEYPSSKALSSNTTRLLMMDSRTGQLIQRVLEKDRENPERDRLRREASRSAATSSGPAIAGGY